MASTRPDAIATQVDRLLRQLTLEEKVGLLSGKNDWATVAVERLGIPSIEVCDGPHGVRLVNDGRRGTCPTTAFPTGFAMACSWNPALLRRVGEALGEETKGMGCDVLLGPAVNIIRHPLAGRNFECLSEDPYLNGSLATAYITGVQSRQVGTCLKHFACNNQESERGRGSSDVDERTMREIYLPAFETAVRDARPWTMMCAYNRVNGTYAAENRGLLTGILRDEWGYEGMVMSDWGAVHSSVASVEAGLDLEMPGPAKHFRWLAEAVQNWQVDASVIDRAAARVLRLVVLSGKMGRAGRRARGAVCTPAHRTLARTLAAESMVLLKNTDGILPLQRGKVRTIAAIGPNALDPIISGGGSAEIDRPHCLVAPLDALRERLAGKAEIRFAEGCVNYTVPPIAPIRHFTPAQGTGHGLWGEYFDNAELAGEPVLSQVDTNLNLWWGGSSPSPDIAVHRFSGRWSGSMSVWHDADHTLQAWGLGAFRIQIDGKTVIEVTPAEAARSNSSTRTVRLALRPGRSYDIRATYIRPESASGGGFIVKLGVAADERLDAEFRAAVELARASDVAVVFAGMCRRHEGEGADRTDLHLPGRQDELIAAVAAANPRTVVVLNNGGAIAMPWLDQVAAVLEGLYYGQDGGNAIADILTGAVNPSGRLAMTYPKRLEDTPAYGNFPGGRAVVYGEQVLVGYRHYDTRDVEPLFPFGFGLSYTTFAYSHLAVPASFRPGQPVTVSVRVTNTGTRAGQEVVQVYVHDCEASVLRPTRELKGFAKVALKPGQTTTVTMRLEPRAFAFYDTVGRAWKAEPGRFEIQVGSSSRDIRLTARSELKA